MIQVLNKATGEIMELADKSPDDIKNTWLALSETIKACERAKDKLKPKVEGLLDDNGLVDLGDYQFRRSIIQRMNYDKAVMRNVLDADTFDMLLAPDKTFIDKWLKENAEQLGDVSTKLRKSMLTVGEPYTTIRLEKKS